MGGREVWIQHHGNIPLPDILQRQQQRHTEYVDTAAACHVSKQVIVRCWRCWGGAEVRGHYANRLIGEVVHLGEGPY